MKIYVKTFGCRTNIYDSELIKGYIIDNEIVEDEELCDIVIVNSCTVTNGADSDVRNYINKMNKKGKKVFLTGCGAVSKGKELYDKDMVFGVFGMSKKDNVEKFINSNSKFYEIGNLNSVEKDSVKDFSTHTKAFVKIQEGCDFNCSYCIIPSVRGKARSMQQSVILDEIKRLSDNGFSEFVLTGTNIGSYGKDINSNLARLLKDISKINGVKRIRLGSIEPSQIDKEFEEILSQDWIERHLHIALQHTSQRMLNIMRRRNKAFKDIELFNRLASLGYALGTDYIVAHPGESEDIWAEALENFKKFPLTHLHAFIYSARDNTHSATMKIDVNGVEAKKRLKILQNIVFLNNLEFRKKHKNELLDVLVERKNGEFYEGYDQFYNKIQISSQKNLEKQWIRIQDYEVKTESNFCEF